MLFDEFGIDKETHRKDFYSPENEPQRTWFFQHFKGIKRQQIQEKFYKFVERVKINIPFFDWFHAYTIKKNMDYPWQAGIIGDPTTNVINNWKIKDGELIQSEYLPQLRTNYQRLRTTMINVLRESISKEKVFTKLKDHEASTSQVPIENPLFKPFKVSEKAKQKFKELRKQKSPRDLLNTIPEIPQPSEESSKLRTRQTSKLINVIDKDREKTSEQASEEGSIPTTPDLLLEERGKSNFKSFSANNIYEWNINAQIEYNIMNTLQHMTMVATTYQTSHDCLEETIVDILVAGFSGWLKGWWDNYLTNDEKSRIYSAIKKDLNAKVITDDGNERIPDAINTLIFTIAQHFIGDPSLWKDRDTFMTRVYTREDSQQPFWKEKFLAGLPRALEDKDDKIQRQLAKEKAQNKRDLVTFCEQFGLPTCPKKKKKQHPKKGFQKNKFVSKKRFSSRKNSDKPSTSKETNILKSTTEPRTKVVYYNYGRQCYISKYYMLKKKLRNLNLDPSIEEQINNLLIETSKKEIGERKTSTESSRMIKYCLWKMTRSKRNLWKPNPNQKNLLLNNKFDEPSKPQTSKQTKADYAIPIETLLALQEIGLTKLPKKTWANIASESDDESEIDLKTMIQKTKASKFICGTQKGKQIITPTTTPAPKPSNNYIYKNKFSNVLQMELEYWDKNPFKATTKAFPPEFHFKPIANNKTRTFYEFILIDSNSVSIKHFKDPNDPLLNTHSTIQILKGHAFVKWWNQFDTTKAELDKVKIWFKAHPKFLKASDLETSLFLNQKSKLVAFLAGSKSKDHLTKDLKEVLQLLRSQEERESSSKKVDASSSNYSEDFYQLFKLFRRFLPERR
ncbi:hypothetical protein HKD37_18G050258 [Glycine soja]